MTPEANQRLHASARAEDVYKAKTGYDCPSAKVSTAGSTTMIFCHLHTFGQTTNIAQKNGCIEKAIGISP